MLRKILVVAVPIIMLGGVLSLMAFAAGDATPVLLDTHGSVATAERNTLYFAVLVMLIIILPVFGLLLFISLRYREGNKLARYSPDWASNRTLETIWWGVPIIIILVLSVVAWQTSHSLDPFRPLESDKKALQIQVVALQWKWLFLYPDSRVASVGEFAMPINTPVEFTITSDAPMNSFWIPQLGGQIYAMAGMSTKLHLDADKAGDYRGVSANISGEGHSEMTFTARAMTDNGYASWIDNAKTSKVTLDSAEYEQLRLPSRRDSVASYKLSTGELYDSIIARYSDEHMMSDMPEMQITEGNN